MLIVYVAALMRIKNDGIDFQSSNPPGCQIILLPNMSIPQLIFSKYRVSHPPVHITCIVGLKNPLYFLIYHIRSYSWEATLKSFSFLVPADDYTTVGKQISTIIKHYQDILGDQWQFITCLDNKYGANDRRDVSVSYSVSLCDAVF